MTDDRSNYSAEQHDEFQATNLPEFRGMVDDVLNSDIRSSHDDENTTEDEQSLDSALLSLEIGADQCRPTSLSTTTGVAVAELPPTVKESFNVAAQRLSLLYETAVNLSETNDDEELQENERERANTEQNSVTHQQITNGSAQPVTQTTTGAAESSVVPKSISNTTMDQHPPAPKRHIMISYNQSSRPTCKRIYDRLVEQNYKVWMDMTDMFDNVISGMAHAVENSYIVLLCINQQYFESRYCQLEAEYAAENRIKFIPCLMEKDFRAQSWLGIIKGANVHVDFSCPENFDSSFNDLIRQIDYIERQLSLRPRRTPAPGPMMNPMRMATQTISTTATATLATDVNSRRFDTIIREYKDSIKKNSRQLNHLKRNELADLIVKLRQELFSDTSVQGISESERSDDEDEKMKTDEEYLQQLLRRSLDQNETLLRLLDRVTTPQPTQTNHSPQLDLDGIIKVILAIMLLWTLNFLCQKE